MPHNGAAKPRAPGNGDAQAIDWRTSPLDLDLRGMNGERYSFSCPPGKPDGHLVTGSGIYTDASSICSAAVHAGALHAAQGGPVVIEIRPGLDRYEGATRNFVRSASYVAPWGGSFAVLSDKSDSLRAEHLTKQ